MKLATSVSTVKRIKRHEATSALFTCLLLVIIKHWGKKITKTSALWNMMSCRQNIPVFSSATVIFGAGRLYLYYCVHKSAPLDRILKQTNPLNITFSFLKIYVNIILPYRPEHHNVAGGFRFWQRCGRGLRSSVRPMWHQVTGWSVPYVSRQPGGLIFHGQKR